MFFFSNICKPTVAISVFIFIEKTIHHLTFFFFRYKPLPHNVKPICLLLQHKLTKMYQISYKTCIFKRLCFLSKINMLRLIADDTNLAVGHKYCQGVSNWKLSFISVEFLQLGLQWFKVADGLLKGSVRAQRLQFHEVSTDVVQAHVRESAPGKYFTTLTGSFKKSSAYLSASFYLGTDWFEQFHELIKHFQFKWWQS